MSPDPTSLDRLHDVVTPAPVPWWPPAPGWIWLSSLAIVFLLALALRILLRWQRNRYRREALAELRRHEKALADATRRPAAFAAMAVLLKRAALSAWPREQVAPLSGAAWFAFLDHSGGTTGFSNGTGALLESAAYDPASVPWMETMRDREVAALVRRWLARHRVGKPGAPR